MLALAPTPVQQHTAIQFSQPTSLPSSVRPSRPATRRVSSFAATVPSSSSSSTVTAPPSSRASNREGPSSPRRTLPHSSHSSQYDHPSSRTNGDRSYEVGIDSHAPPEGSSGPRRSESEAKSVDIHTYDPQDLLRLLASLLAQIATTNDTLTGRDLHPSQSLHSAPSSPSTDTHHPPIWRTLATASRSALSSNMSLTFHARNVPTISLEAYLLRILKYCPASNEVFLSLLVYFDRMSKLAKEASGRDFVIDSYNIHRLVIAGVTVASKFFSDVFYTNSRYAKVGGLPQAELNQLELQFLLLNDFRLMISVDEMQRYAEQLIHFSQSTRITSSTAFTSSPSPSSPVHQLPAGPSKFMSSVDGYREHDQGDDGYGGDVHPSRTPQINARTAYRRSSSSYSTYSTDATSEAGTETDFDGSTDDEPTIRPANSSASSETMSLHSDADSIYTDDGDRSVEGSGSEAHTPGENPLRDYRMMSP